MQHQALELCVRLRAAVSSDRRFRPRGRVFFGLLMLTALLGSTGAYAASPEQCSMRLVVELTPDIPNPRDPGFLSSLLSNHPEYQLTWVREDDLTTIVVDLTGPGPDDKCKAVVGTMREDGRVLTVKADTDNTQAVSITGHSTPEEVSPSFQVSRAGLGSLFWAALHPSEALTVVSAVEPDSASYSDYTRACRAKADLAAESAVDSALGPSACP
jgi:hypothetical protein